MEIENFDINRFQFFFQVGGFYRALKYPEGIFFFFHESSYLKIFFKNIFFFWYQKIFFRKFCQKNTQKQALFWQKVKKKFIFLGPVWVDGAKILGFTRPLWALISGLIYIKPCSTLPPKKYFFLKIFFFGKILVLFRKFAF